MINRKFAKVPREDVRNSLMVHERRDHVPTFYLVKPMRAPIFGAVKSSLAVEVELLKL